MGAYQTDYKLPRVQQWNLTIERQLPGSFVLRAAYAGSHGSQFDVNRNINAARYIPGTDAQGNPLSTTANVNTRRDIAGYQSIYLGDPVGISNMNMMMLSVERRLSHGFSLKANYTLEKSLDDAPQNVSAPHQNLVRNPLGNPDMYGPSDFDRTHRLVSNFVWLIPAPFPSQAFSRAVLGGWELSGIETMQTGAPFTVGPAGDVSRSGAGVSAFADYIGGCNINARPAGVSPLQEWFNTSCFRNPPVGTFGNLGRNRLRGPHFRDFDMGIYRNFKIYERLNLQFRAEMFNIFNHPNFAGPSASLGNPALLGKITSTSGGLYGAGPIADPRIIQFALKFVF